MTSLTVASSRSIWARTSVVDALTLLTIVSILGRNSTNMECVISAVGRTLVFTSAASASMRALVLRTDRYKATRMPAWSTTAAVVTAMKIVGSINVAPLPYANLQRCGEWHRLTDSSNRRLPWWWLPDKPAGRLHTQTGTALSAGSGRRGHDPPSRRPAREPRARDCARTPGPRRPWNAALPGFRCPRAAHIRRLPARPRPIPRETRGKYCYLCRT